MLRVAEFGRCPFDGIIGEAGSLCNIDDDREEGYTIMITAEALFADAQGPFMLVPEYYEPTSNDFALRAK